MMAQKYPELFDGILAVAPAINWDKFLPGMHWPYIVMKELGESWLYLPDANISLTSLTN